MNPSLFAARIGLSRGWIEFRQTVTNAQDLLFTIITTGALVLTLYFQRGSTVPGLELSLAAATLPGLLGLSLAFNGVIGAVGRLSVEREDGTLLRAKALPQGMLSYLVGCVVSLSLAAICGVVLVLAAGLFLVPELAGVGLGGWLTIGWVTVLGLTATLPWGAVIGSFARSPQAATGLSMLTFGGVAAVSGIFYPITALAGWLQVVGQAFPVYWLGLGMRSALLPDAAAAAELTGSWRPWQTLAVLLAWSVAGLLLAPPILRRMARRETGSLMQARRERASQRIG
ncbi:ABC transporter permease [Nonomuraea sp. MCN248]|uniref:ABC transporter permease n=1 Tax=Nonomuraea corallina TaxID=2989783 RepID=A0ABT4SKR7_9ACTN|nr:ABC transporter permease [Nonomuraea corallina]MDA0637823.1 ABC transporter permease [Nonomuraea corallina]